MLRNAVGGGEEVSAIPEKSLTKVYDSMLLGNISVTIGWVGLKFLGKKCYVTLELSGPHGSGAT